MGFMQLAKERYTVRKYADKPLEKEQLDKLLECLLIAPTAKNLQPVRVYVIEGEKNFAKLDELTKCRYGAPCVLAFTYNKDEDWKNSIESGFHSGEQDVSIVATHIMLRAQELGLGTTWINWYAPVAFERAFDIPVNESSVLLMCVGYAADDAHPARMHSETRPLDEMVRYL